MKFELLQSMDQTRPYGLQFEMDMWNQNTMRERLEMRRKLAKLFNEESAYTETDESSWYSIWNEIWFKNESDRLLALLTLS